jgi:arylsulfatase A-like enzyme
MRGQGARRRPGRVAAVAGCVVVAGLAIWAATARDRFRVPARLAVTELVRPLRLADLTIAESAQPGAVRVAAVNPRRAGGGLGTRDAVVVVPPTRLRVRTARIDHGVLRFAVGMEPDAAGTAGPVRFAVRVDGRERWARVLSPAVLGDRRWHQQDVALDGRGPEVEIELVTTATGPAPVGGIPGWSGLRLLRRTAVARQAADARHPSVLVLLVDALRADALGIHGASPSPSPVLDALAARGLVFETAIAQASWTLPSVATLFTGLHPRTHGVARPGVGTGAAVLPAGVPTLAERASHAGVTTVGVSASMLVSPATQLARGFESFFRVPWRREAPHAGSAARVNARFLRWLRPNRRHRFFAYLHYMEPHEPYVPPAGYRVPVPAGVRPAVAAGDALGVARAVDAPPLAAAELRHLRRLYAAEVRAWDAALGELLAGLDRLGVRDSTVVVVTADHGEELADHGGLLHGMTLYDEVLHVPLVIVGPGVPAGRVPELVQGIDGHPTIAALLGLPRWPALPGVNLLAERPSGRRALVEIGGALGDGGPARPLSALRGHDWKLIHDPGLDRFELYDLVHDPAERDDRFRRAPGARALAIALAEARDAVAAAPRETAMPAAQVMERLRAIGYVE